ncbi:MAG TPA: NADH-quinone oxidoreductase subunit J, partial [Methylomirabilota bacterium]|nr:NADH-quinone oxidoreductase subunit J [Methylomirabilota bacterium]
LLYAGGVVTIVVFAIMLTERLVGQTLRSASRYLINGAVISLAVFVGIGGFLIQAPPSGVRPPVAGDLTIALGRALVGPFAVPLELLGVLLVIALLGALYFARSEP